MLIINEEQAALYSAKYEAEWNRFQLELKQPEAGRAAFGSAAAPTASRAAVIAFVGASPRPNTPGHDMLLTARKGGFLGRAYAINPNYREIEGFPCLPSLSDLPERPDLAVLSVRNERLEESSRRPRPWASRRPSSSPPEPWRRTPRLPWQTASPPSLARRGWLCAAQTAWASTTTSIGHGSAAFRARVRSIRAASPSLRIPAVSSGRWRTTIRGSDLRSPSRQGAN